MPTYLVVANETLESPTLEAAIAERLATGSARFHVVVPTTPVSHGLTWDEETTRADAHARLDAAIMRFHDLGVDASGEIGAPDPVDAACDALKARPADEILLSTLPVGLSRWLRLDVPSRMKAATNLPMVVLTPQREVAHTPS